MRKIYLILSLMMLLSSCSNNDSTNSTIEPSQQFESQKVEISSSEQILPVKSSAVENITVASSSNSMMLNSRNYYSNQPAKQSWPKAYEIFYRSYYDNLIIEYPDDSQYQIRENFLYRNFTIDDIKQLGFRNFKEFSKNIESDPDNFMKVYIKEGNLMALLNSKGTGSFYGEGEFEVSADGKTATLVATTEFSVGSYNGRTSMTMTEGIENQLLDMGFRPETTRAFSLNIHQNYYGICFTDDDNIVFVNNSNYSQNIKQGIVYKFSDIADEIDSDKKVSTANPVTGKPVIYLYPEKETNVKVLLDYPEKFSYTYPDYKKGWEVTAYPDGRLINESDNKEIYYLFWEGDAKVNWDLSNGFVVKSSEIENFLEEKLKYLGLNSKEINDFITYWAPEMKRNQYNLINFSTKQYQQLAKLSISPKPDNIIRVHMVYKACGRNTKIKPQILEKAPDRNGFTAVEWGGTRA